MSDGPRETAAKALLNLVANAYPWQTPPVRKLVMWDDPPAAKGNRPIAFQFEGGTETHSNKISGAAQRTIEVRLFVYVDSTSMLGSSQLNAIADALDAALAPQGADLMTGRNTLGGAAYWARIEGATLKVPGDLDGDGIMVVPVRITLP